MCPGFEERDTSKSVNLSNFKQAAAVAADASQSPDGCDAQRQQKKQTWTSQQQKRNHAVSDASGAVCDPLFAPWGVRSKQPGLGVEWGRSGVRISGVAYTFGFPVKF